MPERKSFLLRMNPEVHAALQRWADDELRSLNGQIEYLLLVALKKAGRWPRTSSGKRGGSRPGR